LTAGLGRRLVGGPGPWPAVVVMRAASVAPDEYLAENVQ